MKATGSSIDWYRSQYLHWQHAASLIFCLFMFPWKPDFRAALKNLGTTNVSTMKISHSNGWSKSKCTFLQLKSGWNERRPVLPSSSNLQPASIMKRLTGTLEAREFCSHRSCKDFTKSVSVSHLNSTFLSCAFHVPTITLHINGQRSSIACISVEAWPLQLHLGTRPGLSQSAISSVTQSRKHPEQFPAALPCKSHVNLRQGTELTDVSWCFYVLVALELTLIAYVVATSVCLHAQSDTCAP